MSASTSSATRALRSSSEMVYFFIDSARRLSLRTRRCSPFIRRTRMRWRSASVSIATCSFALAVIKASPSVSSSSSW